MTDALDPNFKWREGAAALTALDSLADERHGYEKWLEDSDAQMRKAIRYAREVGVPEEGIERITGLNHAEVDRIAGTVDQPDPGGELASAKVQALAQLEHLRRELAYNYPAATIREKRRDADSTIVEYCHALESASKRARST